jgi:hypothetical protein
VPVQHFRQSRYDRHRSLTAVGLGLANVPSPDCSGHSKLLASVILPL